MVVLQADTGSYLEYRFGRRHTEGLDLIRAARVLYF